MYLLNFYVPEPFLDDVKNALFMAGAGKYGKFSQCAWETLGHGQYQTEGKALTKQPEYKVEVFVEKNYLASVIQALKQHHPCDEPAFYVNKIDIFEG